MTNHTHITQSQVISARSTLFSSSLEDDDQLVEPSRNDGIFGGDFPLIWPNLPDVRTDISTEIIDTQQTVPDDIDEWPEETSSGYTFPDMPPTHSDNFLINHDGLGSNPSGITPGIAWPSPSGSEDDDSFALDLEPDHEEENVNMHMKNAEFDRAVFRSSLSDHHPPQLRDGAFVTFVGLQEEPEELVDFDMLVDTGFGDEDWSCEDEMLFDLADILDESAGLNVEVEPLCVSQVPSCTPDREAFFQVTSHAADQEYVLPFDKDDQVDQGSEDGFTDVWDL